MWHETLPSLPKHTKYSLGLKIDELFLGVIENVLEAAGSKPSDKCEHLHRASSKLDLLKFFLQIAWEVKAISNNKFLMLSEKLVEIGKMLGGWIKRAQ
ncbi:four helix bundle protein [Patescibacteria group bacterium]|nr:four helix bundle protein [Patescibacteria group bacterium]